MSEKSSNNSKLEAFLGEVITATGDHFGLTKASIVGATVVVEGTYIVSGPEGPFDEFQVQIVFDPRFPRIEPKVFELGGRIPQLADHHVNPDKSCCLGVWELWLAGNSGFSLKQFMDGPLHNYFLAQFLFEKTGSWRFGERPHGESGMVEAYSELLGIEAKKTLLLSYLEILSDEWPKGHRVCPCGSGKTIRSCHRDDLMKLHRKIDPALARRMWERLSKSLPGAKTS